MRQQKYSTILWLFALIFAAACSLPSALIASPEPTPQPAPTSAPVEPTTIIATEEVAQPTNVPPTSTPEILHILYPINAAPNGFTIYDVSSFDTAPERRAPYGDSYKINRLERPFQQDMSYVPDLDIATYNVSSDQQWYYVSIEMIGKNPNNEIGIHFGVEIDNDGDGFGDTLLWASPPYSTDWTNQNLQIFTDSNHDTAGLSAGLSDAPLNTNGYDTPIFDLNGGLASDPDLAWVRRDAGLNATIQFAFKRSLTDESFMLGVLADAGLRDVSQLDYVDRFLAEDAGSPVRDNRNYPLGELYLVDNTCREAFGFTPTGFEPQLCPRPEAPTKAPGDTTACSNPLSYNNQAACQAAGCIWKQTNFAAAVIYYCTYP